MNLATLKPAKGSKKTSIRKGRGPGSNLGKTSGRGQKGAGSRKSSGISAGFEGGQQPLQRRLPKRGFNSMNPKIFQVVKIQDMEKKCEGNVTAKELKLVGLVSSLIKPIKILGPGSLSKALNVKVNAYSASAKKAIEAAEGTVEAI